MRLCLAGFVGLVAGTAEVLPDLQFGQFPRCGTWHPLMGKVISYGSVIGKGEASLESARVILHKHEMRIQHIANATAALALPDVNLGEDSDEVGVELAIYSFIDDPESLVEYLTQSSSSRGTVLAVLTHTKADIQEHCDRLNSRIVGIARRIQSRKDLVEAVKADLRGIYQTCLEELMAARTAGGESQGELPATLAQIQKVIDDLA